MKITARWDFSRYPYALYSRTCDELCNTVLTFSLPFIGYVSFYSTKVKFDDPGLWVSSSSDGRSITVYTYIKNSFLSAKIKATPQEVDEWFGGEDGNEHPRLWLDAEVFDLAYPYEFEIYVGEDDPDADGFGFTELGLGPAELLVKIDRIKREGQS